jgi:hypothetical protein
MSDKCKCLNCGYYGESADLSLGNMVSGLLGGLVNTVKAKGTNITARCSNGSWSCPSCKKHYTICPSCYKLNSIGLLNVGAVIRCSCGEKFIFN